MIRTFIALELPLALKSELKDFYNHYIRQSPPGTNWVKPENMHLTLLFIGDVQPHRINEISNLLTDQLDGFPAFKFKALGLELFPSLSPRLLWLKLTADNEDIIKLNRRLIKELDAKGIQADRKQLKLHITLARLKTRFPAALEQELMQSPIKQEIHSFDIISLSKSVLLPSGPQYTVLHKYNLK